MASPVRSLRATTLTPLPDLAAGRTFSPRQTQVLEGLETIILTEGFGELTVGVLADRLRCSRRTLYELAATKDDLVLLVIDRMLRRLARRARLAAFEQQTQLDRVRAFTTQGLVELHRATVGFAEDVEADAAASALVASHFRYASDVVAGMLDEGIASGEFASIHPRLAAEILDAGLARLTQPAVLRVTGLTLAEALEELLTMFTDGVRPRTAADALPTV